MNEANSALIESSQGWGELINASNAEQMPQSVGVTLPRVMWETFIEMYGTLVLGDTVNEDGHPDMIRAGTPTAPPSMDECRKLQSELALHPLSARVRLAVILSADALSREASNSLLKITEEPPAHGSILFISEEDNLIPTIRSRIWSIHIDLPEELAEPRPMPQTLREWAAWMDVGRKPTPEILLLEMQGWAADLVRKNDFKKAAKLDSIIRLAGSRRLSVAVIEDIAFALFREEVPDEQILGSIW